MDRVTPVSEKIRTRLTLVRIVVLLTTGELASRAGCNLSSGGRDRSRRASGFPTTQPPTVVEWSGATSLHSPPNADGEQPADTGPYSRTLPPPRASDATGTGAAQGSGHERRLGPVALFLRRIRSGPALDVSPVRLHVPGLTLIAETDLEDLPEAFFQGTRLDGSDGLDPAREVAVHPVGRTDEKLAVERVFRTAGEVKDSRVLEEPSDDRDDSDILGVSRDSGAEAAEAADDQVDGHPRA